MSPGVLRSTALALALVFAPCAMISSAKDPGPLDEAEAVRIASEAYIYGYPLVTMEMTRRVMTNVETPRGHHAPMGQFAHARTYPDANFRDVTAPNADTLYSTAWLDVSREPTVVTIPDEGERYFLMPMLSGWTDVFAAPGKRTTGTKAQAYAITGPGWRGHLPEGIKELKSPTGLVWIITRTYCSGTPEDYKAVHAVQDKYALVPLGAYGKPVAPKVGRVDPSIDTKTPVRDQVNRLSVESYFSLLASLMKDNPPSEADAPMVARMARLGIVPGQAFDPSKLEPDVARTLAQVPSSAFAEIMAKSEDSGTNVNRWLFSTQTGLYGTDYLQRAFVAAIGLGANRPQDAIYPTSHVDSDGNKYSGEQAYVMHFDAGQTPPVKGFWSLTMYDPAYFFVANALNRFTLSPRDALKYNRDGSLDLFIQNRSPGKDLESNWLPAPKGEFVLMLRLYWPTESVLNGAWEPPAVTRSTDPAGPASPETADARSRPDDLKAIQELDKSFVRSFNKGNAREIAALFTEDAEVTDGTGAVLRGREAIARQFAETFKDDPKATIELFPDGVRFLGADAARETGRARTNPGSGGSPEFSRYTALLVRRDGRWLHDSVQEQDDPNLDAHDRLAELEWLVGDWIDESDEGVVRTSCRWSEDKNFLLRDFTLQVAGQAVSSGSQRIGWDAHRGQFKSWVFDSDGGHSEGVWTRAAKDRWEIHAEGVLADGRAVEATQILTFVKKGMARWLSVDRTIDGKELADLPEIVLVRTPPRPANAGSKPK